MDFRKKRLSYSREELFLNYSSIWEDIGRATFKFVYQPKVLNSIGVTCFPFSEVRLEKAFSAKRQNIFSNPSSQKTMNRTQKESELGEQFSVNSKTLRDSMIHRKKMLELYEKTILLTIIRKLGKSRQEIRTEDGSMLNRSDERVANIQEGHLLKRDSFEVETIDSAVVSGDIVNLTVESLQRVIKRDSEMRLESGIQSETKFLRDLALLEDFKIKVGGVFVELEQRLKTSEGMAEVELVLKRTLEELGREVDILENIPGIANVAEILVDEKERLLERMNTLHLEIESELLATNHPSKQLSYYNHPTVSRTNLSIEYQDRIDVNGKSADIEKNSLENLYSESKEFLTERGVLKERRKRNVLEESVLKNSKNSNRVEDSRILETIKKKEDLELLEKVHVDKNKREVYEEFEHRHQKNGVSPKIEETHSFSKNIVEVDFEEHSSFKKRSREVLKEEFEDIKKNLLDIEKEIEYRAWKGKNIINPRVSMLGVARGDKEAKIEGLLSSLDLAKRFWMIRSGLEDILLNIPAKDWDYLLLLDYYKNSNDSKYQKKSILKLNEQDSVLELFFKDSSRLLLVIESDFDEIVEEEFLVKRQDDFLTIYHNNLDFLIFNSGEVVVVGQSSETTPEKNPYSISGLIGVTHQEVSLSVVVDVINVFLLIWGKFHNAYSELNAESALKNITDKLYEWMSLDVYQDELNLHSYHRIYRWIRWEAERLFFECKNQEELDGNYYVDILLYRLMDYLEENHFDTVPIYNRVNLMDEFIPFISDTERIFVEDKFRVNYNRVKEDKKL